MRKFYTIASVVLHPVFISLFVVFIFLNINVEVTDYKWLMFPAWVLFLHLILPGMYLKYMRKELDRFRPTLRERETIYKLYMLVSLLLSLAFLLMEVKLGLFFLGQLLLFFLLFMLTKYMLKASWHMAGWVQFTFAFAVAYLHFPHVEFVYGFAICIALTILVLLSRKQLQAHTNFELIMGAAVGIISVLPLFFLS